MILVGEGPLLKENRICTLDFFKESEYIYIGKGVTALDEGIFSTENLKGIYCAEKPEMKDESLKEDLLHFYVEDFENQANLPFGTIGHCPSQREDRCLLCGITCYYEYANHSARFLIKGNPVLDGEFVTEGQKRIVDQNGIFQLDGFTFLGGAIRYFNNNQMITGDADIEGVRYNFSQDGSLYSKRPLDHHVSIGHILLILSALPVGGAISYGVYFIYKKKNAQ